MAYTRQHPSPRYAEYIRLSQEMIEEGHYSGINCYKHRKAIRALVRETDAKTLLDYGCGQGEHLVTSDAVKLFSKLGVYAESWLEALGVDRITGYDPACETFAQYPTGKFDGCYASDVMEHLPEEDVGWVTEDLLMFATKFVFATIALIPAKKTFSNGENVHVTLKPREWWLAHFEQAAAKYPAVKYVVEFEDGEKK